MFCMLARPWPVPRTQKQQSHPCAAAVACRTCLVKHSAPYSIIFAVLPTIASDWWPYIVLLLCPVGLVTKASAFETHVSGNPLCVLHHYIRNHSFHAQAANVLSAFLCYTTPYIICATVCPMRRPISETAECVTLEHQFSEWSKMISLISLLLCTCVPLNRLFFYFVLTTALPF
jgi:hypothetical protein